MGVEPGKHVCFDHADVHAKRVPAVSPKTGKALKSENTELHYRCRVCQQEWTKQVKQEVSD